MKDKQEPGGLGEGKVERTDEERERTLGNGPLMGGE